jgi:murein DD-endopeptidase MepM/ murein hydrolase activator NlpD
MLFDTVKVWGESMKKILLLLSISVIFSTVSLYSEEISKEFVDIDSTDVQQYKGRLGQWINPGTKGNLYFFINKFYVTINDVTALNGSNLAYTDYLFIPFSEKYIEDKKKNGSFRQVAETTQNGFIWPLHKVDSISSTFAYRWGRLHGGCDMPAPRGTPIVAVMDGRVISSGYDSGLGNNVYIEHRDNFYTRYAHLDRMLIKSGDIIRKGQIIGFVGNTGNSTGNHLHFEIRYNDVPLNPLDFLPIKDNIKEQHNIRSWK